MKEDIFTVAIENYIKARNGQTILVKDMADDTKISPKTLKKKISVLIENGLIKKEGKKFFYVGSEENG